MSKPNIRKRTLQEERRLFNEEWELQFYVVAVKNEMMYSRFRLIGPPVNRVSRLIGPNCEERNPIKDNALR